MCIAALCSAECRRCADRGLSPLAVWLSGRLFDDSFSQTPDSPDSMPTKAFSTQSRARCGRATAKVFTFAASCKGSLPVTSLPEKSASCTYTVHTQQYPLCTGFHCLNQRVAPLHAPITSDENPREQVCGRDKGGGRGRQEGGGPL